MVDNPLVRIFQGDLYSHRILITVFKITANLTSNKLVKRSRVVQKMRVCQSLIFGKRLRKQLCRLKRICVLCTVQQRLVWPHPDNGCTVCILLYQRPSILYLIILIPNLKPGVRSAYSTFILHVCILNKIKNIC